jgi:hypothetical protein
MKSRLADLGGTVPAGSPADFGKLIAEGNREMGQGDPGRPVGHARFKSLILTASLALCESIRG